MTVAIDLVPPEVEEAIEQEDPPKPVSEVATVAYDVAFLEQKVKEVADLFDDGFQWSDVFNAIGTLMEAAEGLEGLSGAEKKQFVVEAFKRAFTLADPTVFTWLPKLLARPIVRWVVLSIVPHAIEMAIDFSLAKFAVN